MHKYLTAVAVAISLFYLFTVRKGTHWGDDWTMYVHHTKNMVEGKAYAHSVFIYNPQYPTYSPKSYPPGYPVLLIPVYLTWGLNIQALKIFTMLFFMASLFLMILLFEKEYGEWTTLLLLIVFGMSPFCWDFKENILSDFPLLFFVLLSVLLISKFKKEGSPVIGDIVIGFVVFLTYAIKPLGGLFIPALWMYDWIRFKKITKSTIRISAVCLFLVIVLQLVMNSANSYIDIVSSVYGNMSIRDILSFVYDKSFLYIKNFADLWVISVEQNPLTIAVVYGYLFLSFFTGLLIYRLIKNQSAVDWFILFWILTVLLFPGYQGVKYFLPILPFMIIYVLYPIARLTHRWLRLVVYTLVLTPLLFFYSITYLNAEWKNNRWGIHEPTSQHMLEFIKSNTPEDAVIVSYKPRAVALYTNRPSVMYHYTEDKNNLMQYLKDINTRYALTGITYDAYFDDWVASDTTHFELIYQSDYLRLFKIKY